MWSPTPPGGCEASKPENCRLTKGASTEAASLQGAETSSLGRIDRGRRAATVVFMRVEHRRGPSAATVLACGRRAIAATVTAVAVSLINGCTTSPPAAPSHSFSNSADFVLSLHDAQRLVRIPVIEGEPVDNGLYSPRVDHDLDDRMSVPCRGVFNEDNVFGRIWSNFRNLGYFGFSNVGISQSIAVYPDPDSAQTIFELLRTNLKECAATFPIEIYGDPYTFTVVDARTLMTQHPGSVNGPGSVELYRLDSQILIRVGAHHYGTEPDEAQRILRAITNKIHSSA